MTPSENRKQWEAISQKEEDAKAQARPFATGLRNCEGEPPDPDVAASYPNGMATQYPYNYEDEATNRPVAIQYQDGHHPNNRDDLDHPQIGVGTQHLHDDFKRAPGTVLDENPERSRVGFLADARVPEGRAVYELNQGGDDMGLSPDQRARKRNHLRDLSDGIHD